MVTLVGTSVDKVQPWFERQMLTQNTHTHKNTHAQTHVRKYIHTCIHWLTFFVVGWDSCIVSRLVQHTVESLSSARDKTRLAVSETVISRLRHFQQTLQTLYSSSLLYTLHHSYILWRSVICTVQSALQVKLVTYYTVAIASWTHCCTLCNNIEILVLCHVTQHTDTQTHILTLKLYTHTHTHVVHAILYNTQFHFILCINCCVMNTSYRTLYIIV